MAIIAMNRVTVFLALLLALSVNVLAQESLATLTGRLVGEDGKTGLIGANVQLITVRDTTIQFVIASDLDGNFVFKNLRPTFYK